MLCTSYSNFHTSKLKIMSQVLCESSKPFLLNRPALETFNKITSQTHTHVNKTKFWLTVQDCSNDLLFITNNRDRISNSKYFKRLKIFQKGIFPFWSSQHRCKRVNPSKFSFDIWSFFFSLGTRSWLYRSLIQSTNCSWIKFLPSVCCFNCGFYCAVQILLLPWVSALPSA